MYSGFWVMRPDVVKLFMRFENHRPVFTADCNEAMVFEHEQMAHEVAEVCRKATGELFGVFDLSQLEQEQEHGQ